MRYGGDVKIMYEGRNVLITASTSIFAHVAPVFNNGRLRVNWCATAAQNPLVLECGDGTYTASIALNSGSQIAANAGYVGEIDVAKHIGTWAVYYSLTPSAGGTASYCIVKEIED
jgi:hypothetical protein